MKRALITCVLGVGVSVMGWAQEPCQFAIVTEIRTSLPVVLHIEPAECITRGAPQWEVFFCGSAEGAGGPACAPYLGARMVRFDPGRAFFRPKKLGIYYARATVISPDGT